MQKTARPDYHGKSGLLTTAGFIEGKPGLPHFNYAAQVSEKFLGYVFEITPEVEAERETQTAASTVDPDSSCYGCHKLLTPLAYQRTRWTDDGKYRVKDSDGAVIDDSDRSVAPSYAFAGRGMEAFALQAVKKERFLRTMINTHFTFYFGRELRLQEDERVLYREIWDAMRDGKHSIRSLIRAIMTSPEYLEGRPR